MPSSDTCKIQQLSDEILILILSLLPDLAELVRTSILSRRWRNLWHYTTRLYFDANNVLPVHMLKQKHALSCIAWINKVIDKRTAIPGLPLVKEFRIWFGLNASQRCHIDLWVSFAIENQVESLHLDFSPYLNNILQRDQYMLTEECWNSSPSGPASLKALNSLVLHNVGVTKQFIEFILSSCPQLEDLSLTFAGCYRELNVSGVPPLRLKRLNINLLRDFVLTILDAPCLTSFTYCSGKFHPQKINVPKLTDLSIGSLCCWQSVMQYLDHFWSYLPQLEKLELLMERAERFKLNKMPELVTLKYLKIWINCGGCDLISHEIIYFINACPLLETFALEVGKETCNPWTVKKNKKQEWPKEYSFRCLKMLKLHGGTIKTVDQEFLKCIIRSAPHLKKLIVDTQMTCYQPYFRPPNFQTLNLLEANAKELCQGCCSDIEITVI